MTPARSIPEPEAEAQLASGREKTPVSATRKLERGSLSCVAPFTRRGDNSQHMRISKGGGFPSVGDKIGVLGYKTYPVLTALIRTDKAVCRAFSARD